MAKSGDELEHPVTGERMVWRQVARDTNGELVEGDLFARPGGHPAAAHVHPSQEGISTKERISRGPPMRPNIAMPRGTRPERYIK